MHKNTDFKTSFSAQHMKWYTQTCIHIILTAIFQVNLSQPIAPLDSWSQVILIRAAD